MISEKTFAKPFEILLVEDNPGDADLVRVALQRSCISHNLSVVESGEKALDLLRRAGEYARAARPDLILLDLSLPKKSGREVLSEIKNDGDLKHITVVVLTTSRTEEDMIATYLLHADRFVTKPDTLDQFASVVAVIECALRGHVMKGTF